ncbi:MAG: NifU family protein [Sandaracinaceae bacterium]|nr:NifU family protein [Sandaracinaceae bacterium]
MTRRERIDEVIATVLRPLLEVDGGDIEVVRFEGSVLVLRLTGALLADPGTAYVKRGVIEPAIRAAAGDLEIAYER